MNSKSKYFQSIRGVCILAVILIHSLQFSDNIMANYLFIGIRSCINFCVAVFIFMAGYFTNINKFDNDKKGFYKTKFKRLVIPLLLWNLIYVSIKLICGKYENTYSLIKSLFSFSSSAQLYYILVLIQLFILLPLIIKMLNNKRTKWILYTITPLYNMRFAQFGYILDLICSKSVGIRFIIPVDPHRPEAGIVSSCNIRFICIADKQYIFSGCIRILVKHFANSHVKEIS